MRKPSDTRAVLYAHYFEQVRCLHRALGQFFTSQQERGLLDEATIIVHGDHGPRITLPLPTPSMVDALSELDLIDHYSVLFAVRSPSLRPGSDSSFRPLQGLFTELLLERPLSEEHPGIFLDAPTPYDDDPENGEFPWIPMPAFGAAMSQQGSP